MAPLTAEGSASSDYFDDDSDFLEALQGVKLPGDSPPPPAPKEPASPQPKPTGDQPTLKRSREADSDDEEEISHARRGVLASIDDDAEKSGYLDNHTYGASRFGNWGEYMTRKRAKLQIQNAEMEDGGGADGSPTSRLFSGLQIYINGHTVPSVQELRKLIIQHGGIFHAYLDKKSLVTHVLTCSLTPAKVKEFQHMKVVRPDWLVESAKAQVLLPWQDFIFKVTDRIEQTQGKRVAQKTLFAGYAATKAATTAVAPPMSPSRPKTPPHGFSQESNDSLVANVPSASSHSSLALTPLTPPQPQVKSPSAPSTPEHPHYSTDPATPEQARRVPGYAADKSNPHAQRAMQDPAWRAAHTSVAPDFIEGYYRNSRLHHLSTWKAELKNLVAEAQERADSGGGVGGDGFRLVPADGVGDEDEGDLAVLKIVKENMGGRGTGWDGDVDEPSRGTSDDAVTMRNAQLVMRSPSKKGKEKQGPGDELDEDKIIMHCDFDSFFVSAGLVNRPHLRGKPVVVCHSQGAQGGEASTSEIASASYEARKFGIKSGMSLQQARKLCPQVITMPYEFQRYKQFSLQFYTILMTHADDLQAVSVDEALIEVTSSVRRIHAEISQSQAPSATPLDPAKQFAEAIRAQVRRATGCEVSIGIAHNIMLARVASRRAKPAGSYHIFAADAPALLAPLDIDDLHGFGYAARQKALEKLGATNLGELAKKSKAILCDALGKGTGETLFKAIRGIDDRKLESDKPRKSVSCDINYGIRFENNDQAEAFMYQLAEEVSRRLKSIDMKGRSLTLKVMKRDPSAPVEAPKFMGHGLCETFTKQMQLVAPGGRATSEDKIIGEHAWRLLKSLNFDPKELRGIGVQVQKLEKASDVAKAKPVTDHSEYAAHPIEPPGINVEPPSSPDRDQISGRQFREPSKARASGSAHDLPSFSQVDMSVYVYESLPEDIRQELEGEYKRRSVTPAFPPEIESPSKRVRFASPQKPTNVFPKLKISVKGTNVKRITQQLAPRNRASISPKKSTLFKKRNVLFKVNISETELKKLNLDPEVFAMLPKDIQREQLAAARFKKSGKIGVTVGSKRKLKPIPRLLPRTRPKYIPPPPPQANFPERPTLKQQGEKRGEKLYFSEKDDIQDVIGKWVSSFLEHPPNRKDVAFFAKYLLQCSDNSRSPDSGLERAIAVLKWWLVLLRRHFGVWEHANILDTGEMKRDGHWTSEGVGRSWWDAFRDVKGHHHSFAAANEAHFDGEAEAYEARPQAQELARKICKAMRAKYPSLFNEESTVLMDYACGPGLTSRELAPYVKSIVGVDISQGMVDLFNRRVANQGILPEEMKAVKVELKGEEGELDGQKFDVVICIAAYHHFDTVDDTTRILASFLKPGGSLLIADILKADSGVKPLEHFAHVVAHTAGFSKADMKSVFEANGLVMNESEIEVESDFAIAISDMRLHNSVVQLFLARGVKQ
ncbi:deoxycytidyl transferase [Steccherinum ochraceum]|uniref:DNA repair protein REV1 n=1 Tax=Steccherinum ochraceum TaxID=92696 RepID=A0A4R0R909_9APHY|nr:deoxycytidyl transferase [Steccherinum ochraceum]